MSLIFATQLTAVATAVLAVFAVFTALFAFLAWRGQSSQLKLLKKQVTDQGEVNAEQLKVLKLQGTELQESLDERKREAEQRHRAQAARVFIAAQRADADEPGHLTGIGLAPQAVTVTAYVRNSSDQPIYGAEFLWHLGTSGYGEPNPEPLGTILPGADTLRERDFPPNTNRDISGAVLRFTDAAGARWLRRPGGELTEQQ